MSKNEPQPEIKDPAKGMKIHGIFSASVVDSSAETVDLRGLDVSTLERDGVANCEHHGSGDPGGFSNIVGRITKVKKIFKLEDCEDEHQRYFWSQTNEHPYLYGIVELFDSAGHRVAQDLAAILRSTVHSGQLPLCNFSIEGQTSRREGNVIKESIARAVAITIRPCLKVAISGVLEDPNGPPLPSKKEQKDVLADILQEDARKCEINPNGWTKLGGYSNTYNPILSDSVPESDPFQKATSKLKFSLELLKTLTAGMPSGAPGTLTGGSALQREDLGRRIPPALKAAVRDWDPIEHPDIRKFLKFRLPDVSENFIDKFSELVNDFKIKRSQILKAEVLGTEFKQPDQPKLSPYMEVQPAPIQKPEFKVKKKVASTARGQSSFDEKEGIMHLPVGSFRVYIPEEKDANYGEVLRDPKINSIHQKAMDNWIGLHRLARAGKLPHEVIAHAAMFSAMSPNTAVSLQELAYGFLQDMQAKGWDPTQALSKPETKAWMKEWDKISKGQMLPEYMHDHWSKPEAEAFTKEGKRTIIELNTQKAEGALNYHQIHSVLDYAFKQNKGDARATSGLMNHMKAVAATAKGKGLPKVKGFAPKTIRYLLGMSGGGNSVVVDTHFLRHTFGLPLGDARNDAIKSHLWDPKNEPLLAGLDRYYYQHHPAVKHTQQMFRDRHGEELGENAIFPAFWLHWLTIGAHEKKRNWNIKARNAATDHAVYFNSVRRVLDKYGIPHDGKLTKFESVESATMPARTAHAFKELEDLHGTDAAHLAYYAYMVPALMSTSSSLVKFAKAVKDLREVAALQKDEAGEKAALAAGRKEWEQHQAKVGNPPVVFQGKKVIPGKLKFGKWLGLDRDLAGKEVKLLHANDTHFFFQHPKGGVQKVHRGYEGSQIFVSGMPTDLSLPNMVSAEKHGLPHLSNSPEQKELIEGLDMGQHLKAPPGGKAGIHARDFTAGFATTPSGVKSYVKPAYTDHPELFGVDYAHQFNSAQREGAFYHLAKHVFGLGQHVPPVAVFRHPVTDVHHSAIRKVQNGRHFAYDEAAPLLTAGNAGSLDKLFLMDMVTGAINDRHAGNYMISDEAPFVHLIDNGFSFKSKPTNHTTPAYLDHYEAAKGPPNMRGKSALESSNQPLHPEAIRWVRTLDPSKLKEHMLQLDMPKDLVDEAVRRLIRLKERVETPNVTRQYAMDASTEYDEPTDKGLPPTPQGLQPTRED